MFYYTKTSPAGRFPPVSLKAVRNLSGAIVLTVALFVLLGMPSVDPNSLVYAGSTLTPTVPIVDDTPMPTNTPAPLTETPMPARETPESPTETPFPTATNQPSNNGGGSNSDGGGSTSNPTSIPPTSTPTPFPVDEIPELGGGRTLNVLLISALGSFVIFIWSGFAMFRLETRARRRHDHD